MSADELAMNTTIASRTCRSAQESGELARRRRRRILSTILRRRRRCARTRGARRAESAGVVAFTIANSATGGLCRYVASALLHDYAVTILGWPAPRRRRRRRLRAKKKARPPRARAATSATGGRRSSTSCCSTAFAATPTNGSLVVFSDGYDVLFVAPPRALRDAHAAGLAARRSSSRASATGSRGTLTTASRRARARAWITRAPSIRRRRRARRTRARPRRCRRCASSTRARSRAPSPRCAT